MVITYWNFFTYLDLNKVDYWFSRRETNLTTRKSKITCVVPVYFYKAG